MAAAVPTATLSEGFGRWLRGTRMGLDLTVRELAERAGMSPGTITALEQGHKRDGVHNIAIFMGIADALDLELGYVLHKAGLLSDADAVNVTLLTRVEEAAEAFAEYESQLRSVIAEVMAFLDKPHATGVNDVMITQLGRGLAALDLVTERMARAGIRPGLGKSARIDPGSRRPWDEADIEFLRNNPHLSDADAAAHLNRTRDAVYSYRTRVLNRGEAA